MCLIPDAVRGLVACLLHCRMHAVMIYEYLDSAEIMLPWHKVTCMRRQGVHDTMLLVLASLYPLSWPGHD